MESRPAQNFLIIKHCDSVCPEMTFNSNILLKRRHRMWTIMLILVAYADPEWISSPPKEDSQYKYYVGRAERLSSSSEAIAIASKDAARQAIRDNFGFSYQFSSQSLEDTLSSHQSTTDKEYVPRAHLNNFEMKDQFLKERQNMHSAYVLYRYSKDAIEKEKLRLQTTLTPPPTEIFSASGEDSTYLAGIDVETNTPGAKVIIDGEVYGRTPLKLRGLLQPGRHTLTIDHPTRETLTEDIQLSPGQNLLIQRKLNVAYGKIRFQKNPRGAIVKINGKTFGETPLALTIAAGYEYDIEISHPDYFPQVIREFSIKKNETLDVNYNLVERNPDPEEFEPEENSLKLNSLTDSLPDFFIIPRAIAHMDIPMDTESTRTLMGVLWGGDIGFWDYGGVSYYTGHVTKTSLLESESDTYSYDPQIDPIMYEPDRAKVSIFSAYITLSADNSAAFFLCYDKFTGIATMTPNDPNVSFWQENAQQFSGQGISLKIVSRGSVKSWSATMGFAGYESNLDSIKRSSFYLNVGFGLDLLQWK